MKMAEKRDLNADLDWMMKSPSDHAKELEIAVHALERAIEAESLTRRLTAQLEPTDAIAWELLDLLKVMVVRYTEGRLELDVALIQEAQQLLQRANEVLGEAEKRADILDLALNMACDRLSAEFGASPANGPMEFWKDYYLEQAKGAMKAEADFKRQEEYSDMVEDYRDELYHISRGLVGVIDELRRQINQCGLDEQMWEVYRAAKEVLGDE